MVFKSKKPSKTPSQIAAEKFARAKYFLVFWLPYFDNDHGEISVVSKNEIAVPDRVAGQKTKLGYEDKNGQSHLLDIIVVQSGNDAEALYKIEVDSLDGHILTKEEVALGIRIAALVKDDKVQRRRQNAAKKAAAKRDSQTLIQAQKVSKFSSDQTSTLESSVAGFSETVIESVSQPSRSAAGSSGLHSQAVGGAAQLPLPGLSSLYYAGVAHHVSHEALQFIEALYEVVDRNVSDHPETALMRDVLCKLFDAMAKKVHTDFMSRELPKDYFKPGLNKADLFEDGKIFIPLHMNALIQVTASDGDNWGDYVSRVLSNLYGDSLAFLTTCGSNNKQSVDRRLLDYMTKYCKKKKGLESDVELHRHITVMIHNKKKTLANREAKRANPRKATSKGQKKRKTAATTKTYKKSTVEVGGTSEEENAFGEEEQCNLDGINVDPKPTQSDRNLTPIIQQQQQGETPVRPIPAPRASRLLNLNQDSPPPGLSKLQNRILPTESPQPLCQYFPSPFPGHGQQEQQQQQPGSNLNQDSQPLGLSKLQSRILPVESPQPLSNPFLSFNNVVQPDLGSLHASGQYLPSPLPGHGQQEQQQLWAQQNMHSMHHQMLIPSFMATQQMPLQQSPGSSYDPCLPDSSAHLLRLESRIRPSSTAVS